MRLPPDLALPLDRGAGHWLWLGERPAMDLVNTLRERWARRVETLVTTDDLSGWLVAAGVTVEPVAIDDPGLLRRTHELRESIDAALGAVAAGRAASPEALATIDAHLPRATLAPRLTADPGAPPVLEPGAAPDPAAHAVALVALDAARMLGTEQRDRIRICAADDCSARFYDRSPGGRRRWCSMRECGNVAKARRHRARHADASVGDGRR